MVRVDVLEERRVKAGANALGLSRNDGKLVQAHETARANVFGDFGEQLAVPVLGRAGEGVTDHCACSVRVTRGRDCGAWDAVPLACVSWRLLVGPGAAASWQAIGGRQAGIFPSRKAAVSFWKVSIHSPCPSCRG